MIRIRPRRRGRRLARAADIAPALAESVVLLGTTADFLATWPATMGERSSAAALWWTFWGDYLSAVFQPGQPSPGQEAGPVARTLTAAASNG